MSQHTPGPWLVEDAISPEGETLYLDIKPASHYHAYRGTIANVWEAEHIDGITWDEARANAALISAAPDLLDALVRLQSAGGIWPDLQRYVDAAIAKATGSDSPPDHIRRWPASDAALTAAYAEGRKDEAEERTHEAGYPEGTKS